MWKPSLAHLLRALAMFLALVISVNQEYIEGKKQQKVQQLKKSANGELKACAATLFTKGKCMLTQVTVRGLSFPSEWPPGLTTAHRSL